MNLNSREVVISDQMIALGELGQVHYRRHTQLLLESRLVGADCFVAQQH